MELKESVVLVTGSSDGIGKETAMAFAKEGAKVVVTYHSNKKHGNDTLKECKKLNESFLIQLDVTDDRSIKQCIEKVVDKFGAIDILVNNAGVLSMKNLIEQSDKEIDLQLDTDLRGVIKMTKAALPYMKGQEEGLIINIASAAGKKVYEGLSVYCAAKFGVRGFTKALSLELPNGIKTYSVNPGMTATKMTEFKGTPPQKVASLIVKSAKGNLKVRSGGDVDVWKHIKTAI